MAKGKPEVGSRTEKAANSENLPDVGKQADVELGERIKHLRCEILGISRQADFAERLGVTRGAVGNWEVGKGVKRANLERIARTFHISLVWLAAGRGAPIGKPSIDEKLELLPPEEYDPLYEHFQAMIENRLRWLERKKAEAKSKKKS
ncbi:helix-turn-helix domain-containing protein [Rhizobium leguminosarum]|uniref:Helix-turn-helix domain-containing protein n=1 Tax=Rhizobium ruizarguesonis TaxID=2081791 RepID=A0AAE5C6Z5_9HYPH|nr:helix-turn-helix transcriptional regulator [Rhizobium ruizarguesonis]NEI52676.1 helix-turn-helix domain-containing protein [Rhizobium ruizarguesonis]